MTLLLVGVKFPIPECQLSIAKQVLRPNLCETERKSIGVRREFFIYEIFINSVLVLGYS